MKPTFSISDCLKELGKQRPDHHDWILSLDVTDRLFIGGGCEYPSPSGHPHSHLPNVSICVHSPSL